VTFTAAPAAAPVEARTLVQSPALLRAIPTVATGAVLVWWATGLVRGAGGRDANALAVGLLLLAVALVAVRPWHHLPFSVVALPVVLAVAALAVLPVGGVGRSGAVAAGAYALAGGLVVVVGGWASSAERIGALAAGICLAGLAEVGWAFPAWWAGGFRAPGAMVGTFFWWNPYAAYLLAPALLGLALAAGGHRPWRAVGWLTTPFAVSGVIFSTSRASIACLGIGWIIVCVGTFLGAERRLVALARAGALTVLSVLVTYVLTGPLVFRNGTSPFSAAASRHAEGQTVSADSGYRLDFWRQAVAAFQSHPAEGTGYGRLLSATKTHSATAYSPLAHNGLLQALAEGGLLLALPLVCAVLGAAVLLLLALRHPSSWSGLPFAAGVVGLGLLAHTLVDTDWTYPADVGALAICIAIAGAPRWHRTGSAQRATPRRTVVASVALAVLVAFAGALAVGQHFEIAHVDASPGATS
jgi:O-antigen ligase